jgi:hypothetical protein
MAVPPVEVDLLPGRRYLVETAITLVLFRQIRTVGVVVILGAFRWPFRRRYQRLTSLRLNRF